MPDLHQFITDGELGRIVDQALDEDLGPQRRDVTGVAAIPADCAGAAAFRGRRAGTLCGGAILPGVAQRVDPRLQLEVLAADGAELEAGGLIALIRGPLRSILAVERTALNFLTHLSGIATLTHRYVQAVRGTGAAIYDTRKTIPGLRKLAKYAVACGGGRNHRMGLHDAVLIKDNHIAHLPPAALASSLRQTIAAARLAQPPPAFVEIEVDTLEQFRQTMNCGADVILLDNMSLDELRQAVILRDEHARGVALEASGGVTLDSLTLIARTGVDRIAVGAITHSAPALDIGLDIAG
jgi:nicotinate-nucleotide pyrophosphorylase (carboxylating)